MKTSPILGLPIEQGTDTRRDFPSRVDEPRTQALETFTVPRFADAATRAAKIPAPVAGQLSWLADVERLEVFSDSVWRAFSAQYTGWGSISGQVNNAPGGMTPHRLTLTPYQGNIPVAGGCLAVPIAGYWLFSMFVYRRSATTSFTHYAQLGSDTAGDALRSTNSDATPGNDVFSSVTGTYVMDLAANAKVGLWVLSYTANVPILNANLQATFLGP